jgi:integration host factor subunit alpha
MALTKARIVDSIQMQLGYPKRMSSEVVEILLEIMKKNLENGDDVLVSGFGKFCIKDKNERCGRNPATGSDLILAKRRVVTFKCSKGLRDKINE